MKSYIMQKKHTDSVFNTEKLCYPNEHLTSKQVANLIEKMSIDGYVITDKTDNVLAYIFFEASDEYIEIIRLGTHPYHRRCGYAKNLFEKVKSKLTEKRDKIIMHVPDSLLDGHKFLSKQGAIAARIDYNHYRKHMSDSYQFVYYKDWSYIDEPAGLDEEEVVSGSGV